MSDTDCARCGYRPRRADMFSIEVAAKTGIPDETENVLHVICYECGYEWVE